MPGSAAWLRWPASEGALGEGPDLLGGVDVVGRVGVFLAGEHGQSSSGEEGSEEVAAVRPGGEAGQCRDGGLVLSEIQSLHQGRELVVPGEVGLGMLEAGEQGLGSEACQE